MIQKVSVVFALLLLLGCSNPALLVDVKNDSAVGILKMRNIPKRSEVIKDEKNVVSDRKAVLTGADLYLNSKFVRSIVPASRFPGITRGNDVTEEGGESLEYVDDVMIDSFVEEIFTKATDEEKEYFMENIDEISLEFNIVVKYDSTDDASDDMFIEGAKELNAAQDELYNSLQLNEVAIKEETNRSGYGATLNPQKYRALNKHNRYRNSNERVVKAWELANYFLMNGDIEEVENIAEMFGVDIDMDKLKALNIQRSKSRSGTPWFAYKSELPGAVEWFKKYGQNGDIVSRCLEWACIYGWFDHTGMFSRDRFYNVRDSNRLSTASRCILASYPTMAYPIQEDRKGERAEYASYEPLANFTDAYRITVNRASKDKGQKALDKAESHFYGDGSKRDYHKWCDGTYTYWIGWYSFTGYYNCVSETLRTTDRSNKDPQNVNYCSYIAWYGYKYGADIDLDSDNYSRKSTGNMKVPDDIVNSKNDQYADCWVWVKKNGACGEYTALSYVSKKVYSAKTISVFSATK
ncbi:MAG TPA: hypothetical protein PLG34_05555 [Spirochaetota bacterium]|jgi:hypothetical protein|nr:MAG: hypothetical protein BWX91_00076 [Spirochaetes bacterium ADurb.Bin133]HNZ26394.1 hypothetical protein [Spirochaetota bacterium]HPY87429.1 hypothetical protein [Spirochaetota bacterium]HQB61964.1 hypothetical protein [Spirochaetota bacterium]